MYLAVAGQLGLFTRFCGREDAGGAHLAGRRRDGILSNPSSCLISLRILSTANTSDAFVRRWEPQFCHCSDGGELFSEELQPLDMVIRK